MLVPVSWLRELVDLPSSLSAREIAEAITRRGLEVEGVIESGSDLTGPLKVARVLSIEELTEFKKPIRYVSVDAGEKAPRWIVCGARNFNVDDLVVVALPGAVLPGGFAIAARETYGKVSDGMICSSRELGMSEDHSGIIVLAEGEVGADAIEFLQIRESVIDIAVTPDRGYALSMRGIAREVAIAFNRPFTDPISKVALMPLGKGPRGVEIVDKQAADRIVVRTVEGFNPHSKTPLWMQRRLEQSGMRTISLLVDITNYVMLELGQPLHAFDDAKLSGSIQVRAAKKSESLETLDHVKRSLDAEDAVIADDKRALAIAGVMGGLESEIGEASTRATLEAAHFDSVRIAKASRRHKLSSEASRRFERGVDPDLPLAASARAVELLTSIAGGSYLGGNEVDHRATTPAIAFTPEMASRLMGYEYDSNAVWSRLEAIGCEITKQGVVPPSWRPDLSLAEDLIEEVARLEGYDKIPSLLPQAPGGHGLTERQVLRRRIGMILAARGGFEVLSYPFVGDDFYRATGMDSSRAIALANPISAEEPYLRTSLLSGLVSTALRNLGRGTRSFSLFELGAVFLKNEKSAAAPKLGVDRKPSEKELAALLAAIPEQPWHVAGISVGEERITGWWGSGKKSDWRSAFADVEAILSGLTYSRRAASVAPYHPGRCAEWLVNGVSVGYSGELHPRVCQELGLPARTSAFEISLESLAGERLVAMPITTMVPAIEDLALVVDPMVTAESVRAAILSAHSLIEEVSLFDRYEGEKLAGKVSLAFTLTMRAPDRTLTAEELVQVRMAVLAAVKPLGAELRS